MQTLSESTSTPWMYRASVLSPFPSHLFSLLPLPSLCCHFPFLQNSTDSIRLSLRQVIAEQIRFRNREARHRYTADSNLSLVSVFSIVNLVVMVTAAITQVVVLRRLFKEHRKDRIKTWPHQQHYSRLLKRVTIFFPIYIHNYTATIMMNVWCNILYSC